MKKEDFLRIALEHNVSMDLHQKIWEDWENYCHAKFCTGGIEKTLTIFLEIFSQNLEKAP
ncbi:MAG: hypothetical protein COV02_00705 [Candidatus Terrybacteria bacterium CG10_big_fil_rev_8_21_14_0_10_41_10]|uniref:Uncharacterized protein n=1 Tax=Candidatus Terrybacteria bacterium CG10_big_fil_rev_8_21_14_0_10_41_10 TaxID=1975026 RepID=A0A2M8LAV7_9BACT|nr:MAG: hypothetical protein COV02_00705 [Candidatus Terrybacteria bacterium CG10_big_fil_rev_8_21_14_0_10_41_10]